jgi:hypothetical protein
MITVLQNPSRYKIRPGPVKKGPKRVSTEKSISSLGTKGLLKDAITSSPVIGTDMSPCEAKSIEFSGMDRAYTFNVETGDLGWNLIENNMRQDPIPPEPLALNEARLLCREAMTLITEEVFFLPPVALPLLTCES